MTTLSWTCVSIASIWMAGTTPADSPKDAWLIRPGRSIGTTFLGEQQLMVFAKFGMQSTKAGHEGDTAMGHSWIVWSGKSGHELDVYTVRGPHDSSAHPEQFVRQIRIESPSFHTAGGLRVGAPLESIGQGLTEAKIPSKTIRLFDNRKTGIAFEMRLNAKGRWRCFAILVHPKGRGVLEEYLQYQAYE